jgi:hypothetical protein
MTRVGFRSVAPQARQPAKKLSHIVYTRQAIMRHGFSARPHLDRDIVLQSHESILVRGVVT